jgi:hypothetical protein
LFSEEYWPLMRNQKIRKSVQMYLTRIFTVVFLEFGRGTFKTKILFEKWVHFFRLSKLSNFFNRKLLKRSVSLLKKCKQQPCGVRAISFGISRQIRFFSEVNLSDQCIQPSFKKIQALPRNRTQHLWGCRRQP